MIIYLTPEQILFIHARLIAETGGGHGVRDIGLLDSAIARPRATFDGTDLYPDLFLKTAALMASLAQNHPFVDGNGRTSRLLMNLELMKSGFPPVIFRVEDRLEYYRALDTAHTTENYVPFLELTCKIVEKSFEPYFYAMGIKKSI